jgi:uncharacterized protein YdaU (DUF1376 family)
MPLWVGDLQTSTSRLTVEQFGAYMRLLLDYWSNGPLPADDAQLAQITRVTKSHWRRMRPILAQYFDESDGKWTQTRSDDERKKAKLLAAQRSQKARKAAETRWSGNGGKECTSDASSILEACSPSSQSLRKYRGRRSGAHPSIAEQIDTDGVHLLTADGTSPGEARAIISGWRERYEERQVLSFIWQAICEDVAEPIEWIEQRLVSFAAESPRASYVRVG